MKILKKEMKGLERKGKELEVNRIVKVQKPIRKEKKRMERKENFKEGKGKDWKGKEKKEIPKSSKEQALNRIKVINWIGKESRKENEPTGN